MADTKNNISVEYKYLKLHGHGIGCHYLGTKISMRNARRLLRMVANNTSPQDSCVNNLHIELSESAAFNNYGQPIHRTHTCLYLQYMGFDRKKFHACTNEYFDDLLWHKCPPPLACMEKFQAGKCTDEFMRKIGAILWPQMYAQNKQNTK